MEVKEIDAFELSKSNPIPEILDIYKTKRTSNFEVGIATSSGIHFIQINTQGKII